MDLEILLTTDSMAFLRTCTLFRPLPICLAVTANPGFQRSTVCAKRAIKQSKRFWRRCKNRSQERLVAVCHLHPHLGTGTAVGLVRIMKKSGSFHGRGYALHRFTGSLPEGSTWLYLRIVAHTWSMTFDLLAMLYSSLRLLVLTGRLTFDSAHVLRDGLDAFA